MSKIPLLDKLRAQNPTSPWFLDPSKLDAWRAHRDRLLLTLRHPQLPAFQIGEIANYYYEFNPREHWDLRELEGLKVPYGCAWMEHPHPKTIHSEIGDTDVRALTEGHAGFLAIQAKRADVEGQGIPAGTHSILLLEIFIDYKTHRRTEGPHGTWTLALDSRGSVREAPWMQGFQARRHNEHMKLFQGWLWPALLAMSETALAGLREPAFL